ncbi:hypothetical protein [Robertmurraya sp.]|uniref:hypothetical protein n=1 Tax=Robertmurraya sp. TaxID=2837525 RepID=UPI00370380A6
MMINIAKDYRKYSSEELRDKAYMGTLECNGYDLSDFLEYIFQDMISQDDLDKAVEEAEQVDGIYCAECGEMM